MKTNRRCGNLLIESEWIERGDDGFVCTLEYKHEGPHRMESDSEDLHSRDILGNEYHWVMEWSYDQGQPKG